MNDKWIEEIKRNDEMTILDRYFPGKSCGNVECEQLCIELCKIAERMVCMKKNEISSAVARSFVVPGNCPVLKSGQNYESCRFQVFSKDRITAYDDRTGRKIIGKKYISDADASKSGACKKCLEYANRIFKWPEEADKMPKLPLHPNCKCHYEDVYEETNTQSNREKEEARKAVYGSVAVFLRIKQDIGRNAGILIEELYSDMQKESLSVDDMEQIFTKIQNLYFCIKNGIKQILQYIHANLPDNQVTNKKQGQSESISDVLVRIYMSQIGTTKFIFSAEEHYNRMKISLQQIKNLPKDPETAKKWGYIELDKSQSLYHGANNRKFVHSSGSEVIYDPQGRIVVDPRFIGTWNYGTEPRSISHFISDVVPYWIWGNTKDDPTSLLKRTTGSNNLNELWENWVVKKIMN